MAKKKKKAAKKKAAKKKLDTALPIYQVKITLDVVCPEVWRRVQTNDCSLADLHEIIQASMGWTDEHMYAFMIDGDELGDPRRGSQAEYDSRNAWLSGLVGDGITRFEYFYDFGDEWHHIIEIEKTLPAAEGGIYPQCLEGERACPPEDCGGPYGYEDILTHLADSDRTEYDEVDEWLDADFDPEEFDRDSVNEQLYRLRRWLGRHKGACELPAAFAKGDLVQVKAGVVHELYPDIPLGGWVGRIRRIGWLSPIGYAVHWTAETLEQAHPVLFTRSARDELQPHRHWFDEDQLAPAASETPTGMEQPVQIVTRPLSEENPEDRIRMVFGLTTDEGLPMFSEETRQQFFEYLVAHMSFPFQGRHWRESLADPSAAPTVEVLGFAEPPFDLEGKVLCQVRQDGQILRIPLMDLAGEEGSSNDLCIDDYSNWYWESQSDDGPASLPGPIGTIAYYGPDDKTTTKIAAGVFTDLDSEPILRRWVATDVLTNPRIQGEIAAFFKEHNVCRIAKSDGNIGCPHEEGEDFPEGGDCPFCPWWKGKQGSGANR